jgi:hypothetical protein
MKKSTIASRAAVGRSNRHLYIFGELARNVSQGVGQAEVID